MNDNDKIGVITEQGDLGIFNELNDKDQTTVKEAANKKEEEKKN